MWNFLAEPFHVGSFEEAGKSISRAPSAGMKVSYLGLNNNMAIFSTPYVPNLAEVPGWAATCG